MKKIKIVLFLIILSSLLKAQNTIKKIYLIHTSHTDIGYTQHPELVVNSHIRYIDIALEKAWETQNNEIKSRFKWVIEANYIFLKWWEEASDIDKKRLIDMHKNKQIEISAMPFNQLSLYSSLMWKYMVNWLPDSLWQQLSIKTAMQNDVNGFPRSGAQMLIDKGVKYLWMGINTDYGKTLFTPPTAFWWKMPNNSKILVWQGMHYNYAYNLFNPHTLRSGFSSSSIIDGIPFEEDIFITSDSNMFNSEILCNKLLNKSIKEGYNYDMIAVTLTNRYRTDNDPPLPYITKFVEKWNQLKLKPELLLSTPQNFFNDFEKKYGNTLNTYQGEWPDWWAHGFAASPREISAIKSAERNLKKSMNPLFGEKTPIKEDYINKIFRDLCIYYEHTQGADPTLEKPWDFGTISQDASKKDLVYKNYELANELLLKRSHNLRNFTKNGLYIVNTNKLPYTGYLKLPKIPTKKFEFNFIRSEDNIYIPIIDIKTEKYIWINNFKNGVSFYHFIDSIIDKTTINSQVKIKTDSTNWPTYLQWNNNDYIDLSEIGNFFSRELLVNNIERKNIINKIIHSKDSMRLLLNKKYININKNTYYKNTKVEETPYSFIYTQNIIHNQLDSAYRTIEIFKDKKQIILSFELYRKYSFSPVQLYVSFHLPKISNLPTTSNGGLEFTPIIDQLPNSC